MVKITNGVNVFEVTRGAYDGIYSRQGYVVMEAEKENVTEEAANSDISEDDKFVADVEEKPIGQWTKEEVKRYAELRGIDISGTRSVNDARERIKRAMNK